MSCTLPAATHNGPPGAVYEPPAGDAPLDAVELALVRALVPVLVAQIREELAAEAAERAKSDRSGHRDGTPR